MISVLLIRDVGTIVIAKFLCEAEIDNIDVSLGLVTWERAWGRRGRMIPLSLHAG